MIIKNEDLIRILGWAYVADVECLLDTPDYELLMKIATFINRPELTQEYARKRREQMEYEV